MKSTLFHFCASTGLARWARIAAVFTPLFPGLVFSGLAIADTEPSPIAAPIVGGSTASDGEFPFLAGLQVGGYKCGGSIIDELWVLTATLAGEEIEEDTPQGLPIWLLYEASQQGE